MTKPAPRKRSGAEILAMSMVLGAAVMIYPIVLLFGLGMLIEAIAGNWFMPWWGYVIMWGGLIVLPWLVKPIAEEML